MSTGPEGTIQLEIGGMTCASCVRVVERSILSVPAVASVAVNLATGEARVTLAPDGATAPPPHPPAEKKLSESTSRTAPEGSRANTPEPRPDPIAEAITQAVTRAGYSARVTSEASGTTVDFAMEEAAVAKRRFLLSLIGTVPVATAMWGLGMTGPSILLQGIGALFVLSVPGRHFFAGSWSALLRGHTTMDTLIALGAGTAFLSSIFAALDLLGPGAPIFFETAAFLVTFISLGKWLEGRARGEARAALRSLLDLAPPTARRLGPDDAEEMLPAAELVRGDRIVILPGERIPADGVIRSGSTAVDESLLTGEAVPVEKKAWDDVTGGTLNASGRIVVEVTATGGATVLAGIVRMVREAQAHPAPVQRLADRVSAIFVPVVIVLALATFAAWYFSTGDLARALRFSVSVVVIACPCALGLATPTAILVGSGLGLRHGILIKNGGALEAFARARVIFLDKTGTITEGSFSLDRIDAMDGFTEEELLATAAALERGSTHPLARAVVEAAESRPLELPPLQSVTEEHGLGLRGEVGGQTVLLGRREFLLESGIELPPPSESSEAGTSRIAMAIAGEFAGTLHWTDQPRAGAREVIATLSSMGLEPVLLTGDRRGAAMRIAAQVGIERVEAEVRPGEKQEHVRSAQRSGALVAMVGDGINDAPALAAADVGIAIGAGADAAKESGGLVLVRSDLEDLVRARRLACATLGKIRGNLVWAFLFNMIGLPIAAGAFASFGITLRPELAGLAMAMSSVSVVGNSLLLRRGEERIFR